MFIHVHFAFLKFFFKKYCDGLVERVERFDILDSVSNFWSR